MRRQLDDESGMTLVELVLVMAILGIVMAGLSNMFVSGLRAGTNTDARLTSQENMRTAFDRLDYEGRCGDTAQVISSGAGVHLHFPTQCTNASGDVSWCVSGGSLLRYADETSCTGTGQSFVSDVTSGTFTCSAPDGSLPQVAVALTVDPSPTVAGASISATDTFTLHNGAVTAGGVSGCS